MGNRHCGSRGGGSVGEYIEGSQSGSRGGGNILTTKFLSQYQYLIQKKGKKKLEKYVSLSVSS